MVHTFLMWAAVCYMCAHIDLPVNCINNANHKTESIIIAT